jgi:L,D-peptidoglycan transpeptidase YkuD (ErfK/YbiS/YcfS/YnhG family)
MRAALVAAAAAAAVAAVAVPAHAGHAAACPPTAAARLVPGGSARQLVTVLASSTRTTHATVRLWRRTGSCWIAAGGPWPARVGRSGLSAHHREGDGTTPLGVFGFEPVAYGVAPNPGVRLGYHRVVCGDWWDEDPGSRAYNRFVHVRCGARPSFGGDSEALWRARTAYRYFAVIAYNEAPVVPGRGSAMFLHADTGSATNGCVSLALPRLVQTLRWLEPGAQPRIAIGS